MLACAPLIREIGRGKEGARSLTRAQASQLYAAMLAGQVSDLELGAILIALRVKGESADELAGFCDAIHQSVTPIAAPPDSALPTLVFPSYNGARRRPNLLPLLAGALARQGFPVLLHGHLEDPGGRITTAQIIEQLRWPSVSPVHACSQTPSQVLPQSSATSPDLSKALSDAFNQRWPLFVPTAHLHPGFVTLLERRRVLGVRNSTHTVVKLMQPVIGPGLLVTSYTHPEFFHLQRNVLSLLETTALVMRGHEGEAVAHPQKAPRMDAVLEGETWCLDEGDASFTDTPERHPDRDAAHTAEQTLECLVQMDRQGLNALPAGLLRQIRAIEALVSRAYPS